VLNCSGLSFHHIHYQHQEDLRTKKRSQALYQLTSAIYLYSHFTFTLRAEAIYLSRSVEIDCVISSLEIKEI